VKQYIDLVRDYAKRKITYGKDGLLAINGLVSVMSSSFWGGFVSGLPEMLFDEALLWQLSEPMQKRLQKYQYVAKLVLGKQGGRLGSRLGPTLEPSSLL
jgi:hypothetical protein